MLSPLAAVICLLLCTGLLTSPVKTGSEATKKSRRIAISGCLQAGDITDRFRMVGRDGKGYALRSASVNLAQHMGHNVAVKGELKRDPKRDDYDFEGSEINEEYGKDKIADLVDVEVTALKMVATSCK